MFLFPHSFIQTHTIITIRRHITSKYIYIPIYLYTQILKPIARIAINQHVSSLFLLSFFLFFFFFFFFLADFLPFSPTWKSFWEVFESSFIRSNHFSWYVSAKEQAQEKKWSVWSWKAWDIHTYEKLKIMSLRERKSSADIKYVIIVSKLRFNPSVKSTFYLEQTSKWQWSIDRSIDRFDLITH